MEISVNSAHAWILASRPKTLTGAVIPVLLAGAWAWHEGHWATAPWVCCLLFACLMQVTANFVNDLYDFLKGTDREDRLGPERACSQGWITPQAMRIGIAVTILLASLVGFAALFFTYELLPWWGLEYVILGAVCILFAILYTTSLSYLGFGDPLVLIFFGLVPVCGTYYLMDRNLGYQIWILGFISGIAIDALLVINNYRDRDQDIISGKNTLVVRFGERFGSLHYLFIGVVVWILSALLGPYCLAVATIYLLLHIHTWREMISIHRGKQLNQILGKTSRNMFLLSLLLSIAILFS